MNWIIVGLLVFMIVLQMVNGWSDTFKIAYYEATLKNNKHLFSEERYQSIHWVMTAPFAFVRDFPPIGEDIETDNPIKHKEPV